eukprot:jgi/Ulvmu1/10769/UM069_0003.1
MCSSALVKCPACSKLIGAWALNMHLDSECSSQRDAVSRPSKSGEHQIGTTGNTSSASRPDAGHAVEQRPPLKGEPVKRKAAEAELATNHDTTRYATQRMAWLSDHDANHDKPVADSSIVSRAQKPQYVLRALFTPAPACPELVQIGKPVDSRSHSPVCTSSAFVLAQGTAAGEQEFNTSHPQADGGPGAPHLQRRPPNVAEKTSKHVNITCIASPPAHVHAPADPQPARSAGTDDHLSTKTGAALPGSTAAPDLTEGPLTSARRASGAPLHQLPGHTDVSDCVAGAVKAVTNPPLHMTSRMQATLPGAPASPRPHILQQSLSAQRHAPATSCPSLHTHCPPDSAGMLGLSDASPHPAKAAGRPLVEHTFLTYLSAKAAEMPPEGHPQGQHQHTEYTATTPANTPAQRPATSGLTFRPAVGGRNDAQCSLHLADRCEPVVEAAADAASAAAQLKHSTPEEHVAPVDSTAAQPAANRPLPDTEPPATASRSTGAANASSLERDRVAPHSRAAVRLRPQQQRTLFGGVAVIAPTQKRQALAAALPLDTPGQSTVPGQFVVTGFVSEAEEAELLSIVDNHTLPWKASRINGPSRGKRWGVQTDLGKRTVAPEAVPMPAMLHMLAQRMRDQISQLAEFYPNEANAIEYSRPRGDYLLPHIDDRQLSTGVIVTLSLCGGACMTLSPEPAGRALRVHMQAHSGTASASAQSSAAVHVLPSGRQGDSACKRDSDHHRVQLPARCLQVLSGPARYSYSHGIAAEDIFAARRVSITFRQSPLKP